MKAFLGSATTKQALEERARLIGSQFSASVARLKEGEYAWQVRRDLPQLIPLPERGRDNDFDVRAAANETFGADLGIPARVAFAQRGLFEDLHENVSPRWPLRFVQAISPDAELDGVWRQLALYVLADPKIGLTLYTQTGAQASALSAIIRLFEADSRDDEAWHAAGRAAISASHTSHSHGHGHNAAESLECVGGSAARAAAYFAFAFRDAAHAEEAIKWSGWPLRHLAKYAYQAQGERYKPAVDDRGMVNLGEALWCLGRNQDGLHKAAKSGERDRAARYELYADRLVRLMKAQAPKRPWRFTGWFRQAVTLGGSIPNIVRA